MKFEIDFPRNNCKIIESNELFCMVCMVSESFWVFASFEAKNNNCKKVIKKLIFSLFLYFQKNLLLIWKSPGQRCGR